MKSTRGQRKLFQHHSLQESTTSIETKNLTKKLIKDWLQDRIELESSTEQQKDAKTKLQEHMQARGMRLPEYTIVDIGGEAHQQIFFVECKVQTINEPQCGTGTSKRHPDQEAARRMLTALEAAN